MSVKKYLKRVFNYLSHGIPTTIVNAQIVNLPPSKLLKGRIALVTGGTSGIGKAIATAFLNAGADIIITGRNGERAQKIAMELESNIGRGKAIGIELDNIKVQSFKEKLNKINLLLGGRKIDILVNNAGIMRGRFRDCTEYDYDTVVDTNLKGVYFLCQTFAEYFIDNNIHGNILNIISSSGIRPATSPYMISKWGERGLTHGLARLLAPYGIVVNGIAPGPTATPMQAYNASGDISWTSNLTGRMAMPEEIANMSVILTSDIGRTIVGDIIYMSGGGGIITNEDVKYDY